MGNDEHLFKRCYQTKWETHIQQIASLEYYVPNM